MARKQHTPPDPPPLTEPALIEPNHVFTLTTARKALGLPGNCLGAEIRAGNLRASRRSRNYFILGAWLLAWIESGPASRTVQPDRGPLQIALAAAQALAEGRPCTIRLAEGKVTVEPTPELTTLAWAALEKLQLLAGAIGLSKQPDASSSTR